MTYPEMSVLVRCSGAVMLLDLLTEMGLVCSSCGCLCIFVDYLQHASATERLLSTSLVLQGEINWHLVIQHAITLHPVTPTIMLVLCKLLVRLGVSMHIS